MIAEGWRSYSANGSWRRVNGASLRWSDPTSAMIVATIRRKAPAAVRPRPPQCRHPLGRDVDVQGSPRHRKPEVECGRTIAIAEDQSYSSSETNDSNDQNTFHVSLLFRRTLLRIRCAFLRLRLQRLHWQMLFNCAKGFGLKGGYLSFRESMNWSGRVPPYLRAASGSRA